MTRLRCRGPPELQLGWLAIPRVSGDGRQLLFRLLGLFDGILQRVSLLVSHIAAGRSAAEQRGSTAT